MGGSSKRVWSIFIMRSSALTSPSLVDIGPAQPEAQALDGVAGVGGNLGESVGLRRCHGPGEVGAAGGGVGEALLHGGDSAAVAVDVFAVGSEQLVVVREARVHAGLLDGKKGDKGRLFGGSPDGLGRGEGAHLRGAYGAWKTGGLGKNQINFALGGNGCVGCLGGLIEPGFEIAHVEIVRDDLAVAGGLGAQVGLQGDAFVMAV